MSFPRKSILRLILTSVVMRYDLVYLRSKILSICIALSVKDIVAQERLPCELLLLFLRLKTTNVHFEHVIFRCCFMIQWHNLPGRYCQHSGNAHKKPVQIIIIIIKRVHRVTDVFSPSPFFGAHLRKIRAARDR